MQAAQSTLSVASQFILTAELYEHLLSFLETNLTAVYRLTQVCKATSEPALDALWHTLTGPANLLHLLPRDACEIVHHPGQYSKLELKRPLTEVDLALFDKYAPRVRVVHSARRGSPVGSEIFFFLHTLRNPIFLNLRQFTWHPMPSTNFLTNGADCLPAYYILSPRAPLDKFSLTLWDPFKGVDLTPYAFDSDHKTVLSDALAHLSRPLYTWIPDVQHLQLSTETHIPLGDVLAALRTITQLRSLTVRFALDADILLHLAKLPHLTSLDLWEESSQTLGTLSTCLPRGFQSFPALEVLSINNLRQCSSADLDTFLTLITYDTLHSISFEIHDEQSFDFAFLHRLQIRSLRRVDVVIQKSTSLLRAAVLSPLYACSRMEDFSYIMMGRLELREPDLLQMATAWPNLRWLRLLDRTSHPNPPIHLLTMHDILRRCPRLQDVTMCIDARDLLSRLPAEGLEAIIPMLSMHKLALIQSPCGIADVQPVTDFLKRAFPRLSELIGSLPRSAADDQSDYRATQVWNVVQVPYKLSEDDIEKYLTGVEDQELQNPLDSGNNFGNIDDDAPVEFLLDFDLDDL
ncbi:hypothetical protein C8F01DRAFT_1367034 [Mycena amicta]|nr:hypothetical protein C8F01DRAFT_1367034 [Mycena amicta]